MSCRISEPGCLRRSLVNRNADVRAEVATVSILESGIDLLCLVGHGEPRQSTRWTGRYGVLIGEV